MKDYTETTSKSRQNLFAFVIFTLDTDEISHSKAIYNALDFLGDVGGLYDGIRIVAGTFVRIFTPLSLSNYLIPKLFFILKTDKQVDQINDRMKHLNNAVLISEKM